MSKLYRWCRCEAYPTTAEIHVLPLQLTDSRGQSTFLTMFTTKPAWFERRGCIRPFFLETFTKCSCSWANTSLWHLDKKYSSFPTIFEKNIGPYFKSGMSSSSVSLSGKCGEVKIHQIVFIKDIITNNINKNLKITNIAYTRLRGIVNKLTAFKMNN